ncbi:hypothetical protein BP6252_05988 [Coleophoma cylindrospora]|uniref:Alcohol acetyltransferase n=1 Tax=Coleophoma cylindrospora TaxID=1849047 RepID=A0A3D8RLN2_9HELO|nr:hypothetical protein BP6252_05988 [Coleophoma cylindrospora]
MPDRNAFERYASPNEQRCVSREDLGWYHAVIIGAIYEFQPDFIDNNLACRSFFYPLKRCIEKHPYLCVAVNDMHTDKPFYESVPTINLEDHISIVNDPAAVNDQVAAIERVLSQQLDLPFTRGIPPWRTVVLPLGPNQCFVAFAFSHIIGDGPTGTAFHRTFLEACRSIPDLKSSEPHIIKTPVRPLPPPFDTPERLPISWSFLLAPLIASILPHFIVKLLGLPLGASPVDAGTWTGSPTAYDPRTSHSKIKLCEFEAALMKNAIHVSRKHDAKFTGTLHQLVTRALSKAITNPDVTNFISQTTINMRRSIGIPDDEMGNFVSGCYVVHPRSNLSGPLSDEEWEGARSATQAFATRAASLQNQLVGLLRYLSSIRKWTLAKIGQQRDSSYEISNVGAMDVGQDKSTGHMGQASITKMVFAQPGHITSNPIAFNIISVKGGSLVCTVTWSARALGMPENDEEWFVDQLCSSLTEGMKSLE